ncbi:hypothetical protein [Methylocystis sp. S23]
MGDNSQNLEPHEALQADINNLADAARDWLKSIGGKITTQEQADKAANYATEFGKLEKRGQDKHKAEKAPHLEAGRAVDAAWKPVIDLADQKKRFMKKAFETWAVEEQRKRSEEAARLRAEQERQAAEARAAAKAAGEPPRTRRSRPSSRTSRPARAAVSRCGRARSGKSPIAAPLSTTCSRWTRRRRTSSRRSTLSQTASDRPAEARPASSGRPFLTPRKETI